MPDDGSAPTLAAPGGGADPAPDTADSQRGPAPLPAALAAFVLADALWEANRDRERALTLARQAKEVLAAAEDQDSRNRAAEVEAWLEAR